MTMYYGIKTWETWLAYSPQYLKDTMMSGSDIWKKEAFPVKSFKELLKVVSFLNVMNKTTHLMFRGQSADRMPIPTILREKWFPPNNSEEIKIDKDRKYYWDRLAVASRIVTKALERKLPRHMPFDTYPRYPWRSVAPWSVIQHYELWPTPFLDLTTSLRVAASFALGFEDGPNTGFVYVVAVDNVVSDLMEGNELNGNTTEAVVRLSSVCPPETERPHLQEGHLIGSPNFNEKDLHTPTTAPIINRLVAKFELHDRGPEGSFWDDDFPKHSKSSLQPDEKTLSDLISAMKYRIDNGRLEIG